jgi:hypothetical protein
MDTELMILMATTTLGYLAMGIYVALNWEKTKPQYALLCILLFFIVPPFSWYRTIYKMCRISWRLSAASSALLSLTGAGVLMFLLYVLLALGTVDRVGAYGTLFDDLLKLCWFIIPVIYLGAYLGFGVKARA